MSFVYENTVSVSFQNVMVLSRTPPQIFHVDALTFEQMDGFAPNLVHELSKG